MFIPQYESVCRGEPEAEVWPWEACPWRESSVGNSSSLPQLPQLISAACLESPGLMVLPLLALSIRLLQSCLLPVLVPDLIMLCSLSVVFISYLQFILCTFACYTLIQNPKHSCGCTSIPDGSGHMYSVLPWKCLQRQRLHCTGLFLFLPGISAVFQVWATCQSSSGV